MLKKIPVILLLILVACNSTTAQQFQRSPEGLQMEQVFQMIRQLYVDEVDTQALMQAAIRAMMDELDPYSTFSDADESREMNESMSGVHSWYGIGVQLNIPNDTVNVAEVVSGGPAHRVGLVSGDRIISVNDTLVSGVGMSSTDVVSRLRGPRGTTVTIQVHRRGVPDLLQFRMVRESIPLFSIDAAYMVTDDIGFIRIGRFALTTPREFREAQQKLREQGMQHLILDVTDNGGGILQVTPEIATQFLPPNRLVVYAEGRAQPRMTLNTIPIRNVDMIEGRIVVMVNTASASASEILAGALQDWDRAVIVGRRTFGKGTVQRQIPLQDESNIRLTVARYFTPTGRGVHRLYDIGDAAAYNRDPVNQLLRAEIGFDAFPDSLKYTTLVNHRTVLGGGGIMPDYFVPIDTIAFRRTLLHIHLEARGIILNTALDEVDNNRADLLHRFPDVTAFQNNFQVPASMVNELRRRAAEEEIEWDDEQFEQSRSFIFRQLRTIMALRLYDSEASVQIWNEGNDIFQEGLRIISDPERHNNLLRGIGSNVGTRALIPPPRPPAQPETIGGIAVQQERFLVDEE